MSEQGILVLKTGVGRAIENMRLAAGLSQADVADMAKISQSAVSRTERGMFDSFDTVFKICNAMNIDIEMRFLERNQPTTS